MKPLQLMLVFSLAIPFVAASQVKHDTSRVIVQDVQINVTEDEPEPPPPNLKVKFKDVKEWLTNICDHDKPKKSIADFRIGLFEASNYYTLSLKGWNTYHEDANEYLSRIEFEPQNAYCKLPKDYYESLNREQVLEKIMAELTAFAKTDKFKKSFFTKGNKVIFETNGAFIWSKYKLK